MTPLTIVRCHAHDNLGQRLVRGRRVDCSVDSSTRWCLLQRHVRRQRAIKAQGRDQQQGRELEHDHWPASLPSLARCGLLDPLN
eukprot:scaffold130741_cov63-Phaeocystis_antarctica.AAC.1